MNWPESLRVASMTELMANEIATWAYSDAWSVYNLTKDNALFSTEAGYVAVLGSEGTLVGFACSGLEARVPGLLEMPEVLDIGFGMNPIFVGQGHGTEFVSVVINYFANFTKRSFLRCVVQTWNERSRRALGGVDFQEIGFHECVQNGLSISYTILSKSLD